MNLKIRNHTVFKSHATKYCKKGKEKKIMASCNGTCDMCNFSYKTSKELRQHRMNECGIEPKYPCPYCPNQYRYPPDIQCHVLKAHPHAYPKWFSAYFVSENL